MFKLRKAFFLGCCLSLISAAKETTLQTQSAGFVYVTNGGGNSGAGAGSISAYSIDSQTGALLPVLGSPFPDPGGPSSIAVDPKVRFAYVANRGDNTVSAYSIDGTTGALTPVRGSPFPQAPAGNLEMPVSVAVDPAGKFVFVANYGYQSVRAYQIDQNTGALTPSPGSPFPAGINPQSVTVDLSGKFVYVANGYHNGNGSVSAYSIDQSTGSLTPVPGSPFAVPIDTTRARFPAPGSMPVSVTVHATAPGQALYVADSFQDYIWEYVIDGTTGALVLSPVSSFSVPGGPYSVKAESTGPFLYASNSYPSYPTGSVAGYSIDTVTGSLTALPGSPFVGGTVPVGVTVDPAGRFVFTANQGSYITNYSGTVSAFAVDANTGALTPVPGSPFAAGLEPTSVATTPAASPAPVVRQRRKGSNRPLKGPMNSNVSAVFLCRNPSVRQTQ
jgi:6-phosphogluconolactonase (cycloisomerase 2 family)